MKLSLLREQVPNAFGTLFSLGLVIAIIFFLTSYFGSRISLRASHLPLLGLLAPKPTASENHSAATAGWKIYTDTLNRFQLMYPASWKLSSIDPISFSDTFVELRIQIHKRADPEYLEKIWRSKNCAESDPDYSCAPPPYSKIRSYWLNNNIVYRNVDGAGDMHIFFPNRQTRVIVEIYTVSLRDSQLLDRIVNTVRFLDR